MGGLEVTGVPAGETLCASSRSTLGMYLVKCLYSPSSKSPLQAQLTGSLFSLQLLVALLFFSLLDLISARIAPKVSSALRGFS